jgi:hypothetical protein
MIKSVRAQGVSRCLAGRGKQLMLSNDIRTIVQAQLKITDDELMEQCVLSDGE